jgi:hypothetical protein
VLSTPPAFVLSQNQTLQTKTPSQKHRAAFESEKSESQQKNTKHTGIKKQQPHPNTGRQSMAKQQTKTTKHTIEFSNNTP